MSVSSLILCDEESVRLAMEDPDVVSVTVVVRHPETGKAMEALVVIQGDYTDIFMEQIATTQHLLNTGTSSRYEDSTMSVTVTKKGNME